MTYMHCQQGYTLRFDAFGDIAWYSWQTYGVQRVARSIVSS